nr:cell surface exposed luciferase gLUC59 [synthetic construct]
MQFSSAIILSAVAGSALATYGSGVKVLFALICIAVAEAKPTENNEDFNIVAVASNFATTDLDADRGKLPGKKLPLEVLKEMEANARKAGCTRGCLICLSHIKCTPKMKKFIPGRCHTYEGDKESAQGGIGEAIVDIPEIPGFKDLEPMEQFIAQVDLCVDCTTGCLKGLANVQCSDLLKKWLPQRCATFASKIQGQVDKNKGAGGDTHGMDELYKANSTVTDIATTVVTITSCEENKCHETEVTTGVTTVTEVETTYTTYCPLPTAKAPVASTSNSTTTPPVSTAEGAAAANAVPAVAAGLLALGAFM